MTALNSLNDVTKLQENIILRPEEFFEDGEGFFYSKYHKDLGECRCSANFSRIDYPSTSSNINLRKMAEALVLSAVKQFFPKKETIRICVIESGGCFQELVIHALITKIGKAVHWVLVDPRYKDTFRECTNEFESCATAICNKSKVEVVGSSLEDMLASRKDEGIDVFFAIDR